MVPADQVRAIQDQSLAVLRECISPGGSVALLDFPAHLNAGDSLIYQGEKAYLEMLGVQTGYLSAVHTHDDRLLAERVPVGPILLHGGGNFGDRYSLHQEFREQVIATHTDRTIVQLPQTMDFHDGAVLARTREIYRAHPDLHILLRDRVGYERARKLFESNHVHYCPDLAFGSGSLSPSAQPTDDVVILKRADGESQHRADSVPDGLLAISHITDWIVSTPHTLRWWLTTSVETAAHRFGPVRRRLYPHMHAAFNRRAEVIVRGAVATMSRGHVVVTDRLHAAVFAVLLGKPVIMIDNANHKLSEAHRSYLGDFVGTQMADDFGAAADLVPPVLG